MTLGGIRPLRRLERVRSRWMLVDTLDVLSEPVLIDGNDHRSCCIRGLFSKIRIGFILPILIERECRGIQRSRSLIFLIIMNLLLLSSHNCYRDVTLCPSSSFSSSTTIFHLFMLRGTKDITVVRCRGHTIIRAPAQALT
jgi:hypothetical protein